VSTIQPETAAPAQEKRRGTPAAIEAEPARHSLLAAIDRMINVSRLEDIFSARNHSDDFLETRAEYIALRLRFMAFFYAIVVPLWIPFDYQFLRPEHFAPMVVARLLLAGFLLPLGLFTRRKLTSRQVHVALALSIVATCLFYAATILILNQEVAEPPLAGYSFMPFLTVAMLGVFPLTLLWGAGLVTTVVLVDLGLSASLGQLMTADTVNKLWVFAMFGGIALWIQAGQLLMLLKLYRESTQDPLTGMVNRRVLMKRLATEILHVNEGRPSFCILMFDLDRFKRINDNHGHLTGDKVLKTAAVLIQASMREHDIVARFGGEEFVAVLPDTTSEQAIAIAERIRQRCYEAPMTAPDGQRLQLSTSVGVTQYEAGEAIELTLNRVDDSLYKAKEQGRNRVIHSQSDR